MALSDTEKHLDRSSGCFEPGFEHHEGSFVQVEGSVAAGFAIHGFIADIRQTIPSSKNLFHSLSSRTSLLLRLEKGAFKAH